MHAWRATTPREMTTTPLGRNPSDQETAARTLEESIPELAHVCWRSWVSMVSGTTMTRSTVGPPFLVVLAIGSNVPLNPCFLHHPPPLPASDDWRSHSSCEWDEPMPSERKELPTSGSVQEPFMRWNAATSRNFNGNLHLHHLKPSSPNTSNAASPA